MNPVVKCLLSFVYGPPYKHLSLHFWHTLEGLGASHNDSWLCIRDFNTIISPDDKIGGRPYNSLISNPMFDFMSEFGMLIWVFSGNPFTWSNHRQGAGLIKERLDRSITNIQWIHFFPSYLVTHLPAFSFDHNPLLLNFSLPTPSLPRPFRFEDFWTRDPTCGIVIEEAWSTPVAGSPSFCLSQKLKLTKTAIKQWNKQYFGDITTKLNSTLAFLDLVQQAPSDSNLALELHLQNLLDEYLKQEESL
jgi:hypothetical protein